MAKGNRKPNLSERAYEQIKDALCKGKIAAGDILSESQLAEELDMSRTPVREALRILASEGWVEIRRGIGAYVKAPSSKDMEDLYEVRCLLETLAIKTSVFNISTGPARRSTAWRRGFAPAWTVRPRTPDSSPIWTGSCMS